LKVCACLLLLVAVGAEAQDAAFYQAASTKKMADLLANIYRNSDWKADPNKQAERVVYYQRLIKSGLRPADEVLVAEQVAQEQLQAGDSAGAIDTLEALRNKADLNSILQSARFYHAFHQTLGMAYLRLGEQENCAAMHGQKSCIFPVQGSGVHTLTRGAKGAVREFTTLLGKDGQDYESRWLLNIAYMQLGRYPQDVPPQWRVKSSLFRSEADVGDYLDVAPQAGLSVTGHSGGAIMDDFDGDGLMDVMVSSSGPLDPLHFFHNNGDGTFSDRTKQAGLTGETGGLNMIEGDYNNDGLPDLLILRGGWWGKYGCYPLSLLKNNGNGTFDDVTESAGLMSLSPTQTAAWADYDNDGLLDLFVAHESTPDDPHPSQLLHNNGNGTFTDIAASVGLEELGFVKGVAWGDFNNDGRPDLYVSVKGGRNKLFRNDGPVSPGAPGNRWRFTDVTKAAGVATQHDSFTTWFFDYDNDGWPDLFVAGYSTHSMEDVGAFELGMPFDAETPRLYRNNHDGTFTDVAKAAHLDRAILVMGASFGDLDNDGWLDAYLGTGESSYEALLPNRMFRNRNGKFFEDVTTSGGFGHLQKGHAVAFGDLENNGSEDIFEEMGGAFPGDTYQSVLYKNPGSKNHWITLELQGVKTNRLAFGAKVDVIVSDAGGERHIYRTVGYGSSFGGNPLRQHIGIGAATRVKRIEVDWPTSATRQIFTDVASDRMFLVREFDPVLKPIYLKQFSIDTRASLPTQMTMPGPATNK
jgi:hypothetical protein